MEGWRDRKQRSCQLFLFILEGRPVIGHNMGAVEPNLQGCLLATQMSPAPAQNFHKLARTLELTRSRSRKVTLHGVKGPLMQKGYH